MGYVLLIISIILTVKVIISKKVNNNINMELKSIRENLNIKGDLIYETYVKYCGGHSGLKEAGAFKINVYEDGVVIYKNNHSIGATGGDNNGDGIIIKREDILKVNLVNQTYIVNSPKLSNVLIFGVAGLTIGNKKKEETSYIDLEYNFDNRKFNLILSSDIEGELRMLYKELTAGISGLDRMIGLSNSINKILTTSNNDKNTINIFQTNDFDR